MAESKEDIPMSKFHKIFILVILVTVVAISLFVKFSVRERQKTEKTNSVNQTTTTSPQPRGEEVTKVKQKEKQTKLVNQSAITPPKAKTGVSIKKESGENLSKPTTKPKLKVEKPAKKEPEKVLPILVLITTTRACHCTLVRCQEAESMIGEIIKQFSGKIDYKIIDYAKETERVVALARRYKLRFLPALLFFDNDGEFKSKIEGFVDKRTIVEGLSSLGIK